MLEAIVATTGNDPIDITELYVSPDLQVAFGPPRGISG
jgi:hypothetical protein